MGKGINLNRLQHLSGRRTFLKWLAAFFVAPAGISACARKQGPVSRLVSLGRLAALADGPLHTFPVEGVVIIQTASGLRSMSLTCSHQRCQLVAGEGELQCPCHGSRFDLSGTPLKGPATSSLRRYKLILKDGELFVDKATSVDERWHLKV